MDDASMIDGTTHPMPSSSKDMASKTWCLRLLTLHLTLDTCRWLWKQCLTLFNFYYLQRALGSKHHVKTWHLRILTLRLTLDVFRLL